MTRPGPTTCAECGAPISQNPCGQLKLFCSTPCRNRACRRRRIPPPRREHCAQCHGPIPAMPKGGMPRLYCSTQCRRKAQYERLCGKPPAPPNCTHCGAPMTSIKRTKRFCSGVCRNRALRIYKANLPPPPPPPPSPRELLVLAVGWPGAQFRRAA